MAESKDIDAREPTAEELLVLDLLYGELDGDDETDARRRIEGEPARADELAGFGSVRALMRELPDEDPPQAVSAQLLHAAAEAAPSRGSAGAAAAAAGGGGILAKLFGLFRPLVASPALAAATMLVLVAGIAGALYVSGKFHATEPTEGAATPASEDELEPAATAPTPTEEAPAGAEQGDMGGAPAAAPNADPNAVGRGARLEDGELDLTPQKTATTPDKPRPADRKVRTKAPAHRRSSHSSAAKDTFGGTASGNYGGGGRYDNTASTGKAEATVPDTDKSKRAPSGVKGKASDTPMIDSEDVQQGPATAQPAPASPPPPPPQKPKAAEKQAPAKKDKNVKSPRATLDDLHARAVQAAASRECSAVRSLGSRIRAIDSSYYSRVFVSDKRLANCLSAPAKK